MTIDLILTADWHLREDQPQCRTDDYWEAQEQAVDFVRELAGEYDCPVVIAGDVFDKWKRTHRLVSWAATHMPPDVYAIPGQHDLPFHRITEAPRMALNVLFDTGRVKPLYTVQTSAVGHPTRIYGFPYGVELGPCTDTGSGPNIAVCHQLVWHKVKPWPGCEAGTAVKLLKKMKGYDLVVTGDNHIPFTVKLKSGRRLVNPGSLMRMRADQADHKPRVYLWCAEDNSIEPVYLPIKKGVVIREHIDQKEKREARMSSFVTRLSEQWEVGLSFEDNLKKFYRENKTKKQVKSLIAEALENV